MGCFHLRILVTIWLCIQTVAPTSSPDVELDYTTEIAGSGIATEIYTAYGTSGDGVSQAGSSSAEDDGSGAGPTSNGASSALSAPGAGAGPGPTATSPTRLPILLADTINETREALAHEGSEHNSVVYVADSTGYVPINQIRPRPSGSTTTAERRPLAAASSASTTGTAVGLQTSASDVPEYRAPVVEAWDRDYRRLRSNTTRVQHIEAECQDDYMKIRITFNGSFGGLVYSSGYAYDPECVYINGTGKEYYEFFIQLNRCGTLGKNGQSEDSRKNPTKNFMWNTVTVQYNHMIEEEWDEHFKVTCEYGYDFWKTVTFPFLNVEVATGNPVVFTLSPPECYMEIRYGYGTAGTRVNGAVRVGDPLTLIIYMRSKYEGFDIVVNDCWAHNGAEKRIQLIDQYGCPVDDKLISRFRGTWSNQGGFETQVFAYMKTFRFTGSPVLYIECDVRMCHGRCPSQPCHWRNAKSVSKRSLPELLGSTLPTSEAAASGGGSNPTLPAASAKTGVLSENVNLLQSLQVLQEGETMDGPRTAKSRLAEPNNVCVKTGAFQAFLGLGCTILCLLTTTVFVLYCRMRRMGHIDKATARDTVMPTLAAMSAPRFDHASFLTHKGRIN